MSLFHFIFICASAQTALAAPSIFWRTSPVSSNETIQVAGAGFGDAPSAFVCLDGAACQQSQPLPLAAASWESSLFFAYPPACARAAPVCAFALCAAGAIPPSAGCTTSADPNAPEVIFATRGSPLGGGGAVYTPARRGSLSLAPASDGRTLLRLFGRALAFAPAADGTLECIPAGARGPAAATTLVLHDGAMPVSAQLATCYEASFDLTAALAVAGAGPFPAARVETPFGAFPLALALQPAPPAPAPAPVIIDVDRDAGGNVSAALLLAAAQSGAGGAIVRLAARAYALAAALSVPNNTAIEGAGVGASTLSFALLGATAPPAAITGGSRWALRDLTIAITTAPAKTAAVWMPPGTTSFQALRAAILLSQNNVSSALRIEGAGWEVRDSLLSQAGVCLWPPQSDTTDFSSSTTLRVHGSLDGLFVNNTLRWQCSAFDLDVSSRIVIEDNAIECTQAGKIPHGNSISLYDYQNPGLGDASHASQGYFFAHNRQTRPPRNDPSDWSYHESLTTDGAYNAGGWGGGILTAVDGASVEIAEGLTGLLAATGATALVIGGPGAGQWRTVLARPTNTTIELAAPFDGSVQPGASFVAVVGSVGGKLVVDNLFSWGSVIQLFGTTIGNVFAENTLEDQNNSGQGSMVGFGLCYGGAHNPVFFTDYVKNTLLRSNGIDLTDDAAPAGQCTTWPGPYLRWAAVRGNTIGGVAASSPTVCGTVNATNPATSDVLVERNSFDCPPGALLPGGGVNVKAAHAVVL